MISLNAGFRTHLLSRVGTAIKITVPIIIRVRGKRRIFSKMDLKVDFIWYIFAHLTLGKATGYYQIYIIRRELLFSFRNN
jgi:hypothetical protein